MLVTNTYIRNFIRYDVRQNTPKQNGSQDKQNHTKHGGGRDYDFIHFWNNEFRL